jgi:O-antigen/teichoic acid export membrane protein
VEVKIPTGFENGVEMSFLRSELRGTRESPLFRSASWLLVGQGSGVLLQAAYFVVLARLLGPLEYGVFIGAFAFTGVVASYSTLGTGTLLLRYVSLNHKEFAVYWGNVLLVTGLLGAFLTCVLHLFGARILNPASAALVLMAAIANCFCAQLTTETARVFQTFQKMRSTALLSLLTSTMRTVAAIGMLLILHHASAWQWAVASTAVSAVGTLVAITVVTVRIGFPIFRPKLFLKHSAEGFSYSFATSAASVYNDIDKAILSHFDMNAANGIYTMAYRIVDIATIPIISIRDAVMPRLFQGGRAGLNGSSKLVRRLLTRSIIVSLFASAGMFFCAPLMPRIVSHSFDESVAALRWLCLIPVLRSIHQITGSALTGAGLQHYRTTTQLAVAAFNFALNLYLIPHLGWEGAAWSSLASDGALGILNWGILSFVGRRQECLPPTPLTA